MTEEKPRHYTIISGTPDEVSDRVDTKLQCGWELYGELISVDGPKYSTVAQPMIKRTLAPASVRLSGKRAPRSS